MITSQRDFRKTENYFGIKIHLVMITQLQNLVISMNLAFIMVKNGKWSLYINVSA